jgi:phosphate transport system permease protein
MRLQTRRLLDHAFAGSGVLAIGLMAAALLILITPLFIRGIGAIVFTGTIEHRRIMMEKFERGNRPVIEAEIASTREARKPIYRIIADFEQRLDAGDGTERAKYGKSLNELKKALHSLLGPAPGSVRPMLMRDQYGQARWDRAQVKLGRVLYREEWDYSDPTKGGIRVLKPRSADFAGTPVEEVFQYLERNVDKMLLPRRTVYWQFLTDESFDSHFFGGIWPEMLGTFYLTAGAMLLAIPMGLIAAIYLTEYAGQSRWLNLLQTFISTLAGVPSIVFGMFGVAFFMTVGHMPKSVLVGSMTLALLILPTVIRASEEAIRSVPHTYKEAALSLGAGRWHTVCTIILPAALPGILTGIVISMGRAAGETAPIIFTAACSVGKPLAIWQTWTQQTPALSWNIFNLATEHEAVDEVRHVQYGMVLVLVSLVLLLNVVAIVLRARVSKRLRT